MRSWSSWGGEQAAAIGQFVDLAIARNAAPGQAYRIGADTTEIVEFKLEKQRVVRGAGYRRQALGNDTNGPATGVVLNAGNRLKGLLVTRAVIEVPGASNCPVV